MSPYSCPNKQGVTPMGNSVGILTPLDPADGKTLWTSQQWGNDAAPCVWTTHIVGYRIDAGAQ